MAVKRKTATKSKKVAKKAEIAIPKSLLSGQETQFTLMLAVIFVAASVLMLSVIYNRFFLGI